MSDAAVNAKGFTRRLVQAIGARSADMVDGRNIDAWRFPEGRFRHVTPHRTRDELAFLRDNAAAFDEAAGMFEDPASRRLMAEILTFRALGPTHVKLATNRPAYWAAYQAAERWRRPEAPARPFPPFAVERFRGRWLGHSLDLECWLGNIVFTYLLRQYVFSRRQTIRIEVGDGDHVIDAGVCFGDTALAFAAAAGPAGRVFGFEPAPDQLVFARENIARNPELAPRIAVTERALAEVSDATLHFRPGGAGAHVNADGALEVRTLTIDDYVRGEGLSRVDFIKMDIEGSEAAALEGAARTLRDKAPVLAISAYHRKSDLFYLPALIRALNPAYRLFLDHYTIHGEETVIFAVPA